MTKKEVRKEGEKGSVRHHLRTIERGSGRDTSKGGAGKKKEQGWRF